MDYNPIKSVNGIAVKCPSSYLWKLEDVSSPDAGRTEDTQMQKLLLGQVVGIELSWQNITTEDGSKILQAFNSEYLNIEYLDLLMGRYVIKEFYVGNRSAPLYNSLTGLWSQLSFNVIERKAKEYSTITHEWTDTVVGGQ